MQLFYNGSTLFCEGVVLFDLALTSVAIADYFIS
jgi:hypothetical protein